MEEQAKGFVAFLKLPAYILGALAVASGILLFAPYNIIQKLYMTEFRENYGFTLGIIFIMSISLLIILLIKKICYNISETRNLKKLKEAQTKYLKKLDNNEAELIISFLQQPTHTLMLPMDDGLVINLQYFNVISPAGNTHMVSMPHPRINFFLQPWVAERIKESEELRAKFHV